MSIDGKDRLLSGCRPILCINGSFLKTFLGGSLQSVMSMDPQTPKINTPKNITTKKGCSSLGSISNSQGDCEIFAQIVRS